jgi:pyruvate dehydrogenase E2 component (dihydrolipoamide acetyltransferase)/2-oxoisovalerate dehydrogenase E2 component (dihydrolipoyl transacylase)
MDFQLPELGEGVYEAEMSRWLVKVGQPVKPGQGLLEVLTDKASMEVPSPFAGVIKDLKAAEGQVLKVGEVILSYDADGAAPAAEPKPTAQPVASAAKMTKPPKAPDVPAGAVKAAPSVRLVARQLGIDLSAVRGSGNGGRILLEDVTRLIQPAAATPASKTPEPSFDVGAPGTRIKLQGLRRKIAEHMVEAKKSIPHYTYVDECDVSALVRAREELKDVFAAKGAKLTYLAFFVKAVVAALKEVPIVNASLDEKAGEIVLHDRYDIGIAVAAPSGLIVPVVRDAAAKSLLDIARDVERLSQDARGGKSKLEDLRGATFTITSIGNIGGLFATPIIPVPQVGILGIGKIVRRPVYDEHGLIRPADMLYLSLSFDHRVLDGAIGATFGNALLRKLQKPLALALE